MSLQVGLLAKMHSFVFVSSSIKLEGGQVHPCAKSNKTKIIKWGKECIFVCICDINYPEMHFYYFRNQFTLIFGENAMTNVFSLQILG